MSNVRAPYDALVGAVAGAPCELCGRATLDKGDGSCGTHFEGIEAGDVLV